MQPNPHESLTNSPKRRSADVPDAAAGAVQRLLDRPLTDEDLAAATEQVSQPLQAMEKQVRRLLLFRVGEEDLALEASAVAGVMRSASVHRIPHRSNKIVRGLCNVEGDLLLCGDLAALLQLNVTGSPGDEASSSRRMIVVGDDLERWVIEAHSVEGIVQVVPDTFRKPPVTVDAALGRYISHLVPLEKRTVALIDHARLAAGFQAALS